MKTFDVHFSAPASTVVRVEVGEETTIDPHCGHAVYDHEKTVHQATAKASALVPIPEVGGVTTIQDWAFQSIQEVTT